MMEKMLFCDLSIKGQFRAGLWDREKGLSASETYAASTAAEFEECTLAFMEREDSPFITAAAFAAPGWEQDGVQHMPNHGYSLDRDWLRRVFNVKRVHVVNPTVARALSIPSLTLSDYEVVSAGEDDPDQVKCVIGTGPGLGMSILVKDSWGDWTTFCGAGGHADLTASNATEQAVFKSMSAKFGHVSLERAVSLNGLGEIWSALQSIDGATNHDVPSAADVVAKAEGGDTDALKAIDMCLTWLARGAADMVLMTGARGGIYLTGELISLLDPYIDRVRFTASFHDKGRLTGYMKAVPIYIIKSRDSEFKGLASLFK